MKNLPTYQQFISESEVFDTIIIDNIRDLKLGDEVFGLGVWKNVYRIEGDKVILIDPLSNARSIITQSDLDRLGVLVKVPISNEAEQAEEGQPQIPNYTHIELPETNQRIEGPKKTEAAVKSLLRRIVSEQRQVQREYKNSQEDARNEAANVLFNYTDELKGLGWIII